MTKPMHKQLRIAAIFATMNRAATAVACVRALAAQTRPPEMVIVADNLSADETVTRLEALGHLPFELIIHRMPENLGNAGGVRDAMELAFERGADAVWILDDDSWPRPEALAELAHDWDPGVVRHAMQIDPKTGRFTWPLQVRDRKGCWHLVDSMEDMPPGDRVRSRIIWTGALLSREARKAAGPVNGELFIRGEDEEYPWRLEQAGFPQEAVKNSILDHPGPENMIRWHFFGKCLFYERGLADWKLYYKIRNMVWIKRTQSGTPHAIMLATAYALAAARIDGIRRLPLVWKAVSDGWNGRLGKRGEEDRGS